MLTALNDGRCSRSQVQVINADAFAGSIRSTRQLRFRGRRFSRPDELLARQALHAPSSSRRSAHHLSERGAFGRPEHLADVRAAIASGASRRRVRTTGFQTYPVSRLRAVVRRVGIRPGEQTTRSPAGRPARQGLRFLAAGSLRDAASTSVGHGARADARQSPERSGSRPDARNPNGARSSLKPARGNGARDVAARVAICDRGGGAGGFVDQADRRFPAASSTTTSSSHPLARPAADAPGASNRFECRWSSSAAASRGSAPRGICRSAFGVDSFVVLEMNAQAGGNSRWGESETSAYPWAAHYVPGAPAKRATYVRRAFRRAWASLKPDGTWEERYLCLSSAGAAVYLRPLAGGHRAGRWATATDRGSVSPAGGDDRRLRATGRFTVPLEIRRCRSQDEPLDRRSLSLDSLAANRFDSKPLSPGN